VKRQDAAALRSQLLQLKADIETRKRYLAEQETLIDKAVLDGNDRLREIQFDVDKLVVKHGNLLKDIVRLEDIKSNLVLSMDRFGESGA
jgi:hypothetical protein